MSRPVSTRAQTTGRFVSRSESSGECVTNVTLIPRQTVTGERVKDFESPSELELTLSAAECSTRNQEVPGSSPDMPPILYPWEKHFHDFPHFAQSLPTTHDCHIFGTINGHAFDMVGGGSGNPKDGSLQTTVRSTKGPLPFSGVILGPNLGYGYHQYLPFPSGKSPYQNAIKNGGYEKHRTFHFEDGGVMSINFRYTYEGNKIKGEFHKWLIRKQPKTTKPPVRRLVGAPPRPTQLGSQVVGSGFPDDGPVMTNSLQAHDNNVERLQVLGDRTIGSDNVWTYTGKGKGDTYNANVYGFLLRSKLNYDVLQPTTAYYSQLRRISGKYGVVHQTGSDTVKLTKYGVLQPKKGRRISQSTTAYLTTCTWLKYGVAAEVRRGSSTA
ncbi:hypothetical protein Bbelb_338040 [Branchiostoma belcheri]|nr:hypothetical protein Bbelb_338040 [Branchiostoma belcheri]